MNDKLVEIAKLTSAALLAITAVLLYQVVTNWTQAKRDPATLVGYTQFYANFRSYPLQAPTSDYPLSLDAVSPSSSSSLLSPGV